MLHAHAARAHQLQGIQIDLLKVFGIARAAGRTGRLGRRDAGRRGLQGDQLRGVALRQGLARVREGRFDQGALTTHQLLDTSSQRSPLVLRQIEVAAQNEQGGLLDAGAHTDAVHQAVGDVGLTGVAVAGLGAPDGHAPMVHGICRKISPKRKYYGTTNYFGTGTQHPCGLAVGAGQKWAES
jgi:hypothetical protein